MPFVSDSFKNAVKALLLGEAEEVEITGKYVGDKKNVKKEIKKADRGAKPVDEKPDGEVKENFNKAFLKKVARVKEGTIVEGDNIELAKYIGKVKEEAEIITKLSRALLGRYVKKAAKDAKYKGFNSGWDTGQAASAAHSTDIDDMGDSGLADDNKAEKRLAGIDKAVDKMSRKQKLPGNRGPVINPQNEESDKVSSYATNISKIMAKQKIFEIHPHAPSKAQRTQSYLDDKELGKIDTPGWDLKDVKLPGQSQANRKVAGVSYGNQPETSEDDERAEKQAAVIPKRPRGRPRKNT